MLKIETPPSEFSVPGQLYIALRDKEGRVYTDEEVKRLPDVDKKHALHHEWKVRKNSAQKLINYLNKKAGPLTILEVGCGNGWLCHRLAAIPNSEVTGLDVNRTELEQAQRVFGSAANLGFVFGNIFKHAPPPKGYSIIILAASIQYFKNIDEAVAGLFSLLSETGELHIIDSPFYKSGNETLKAKKRSENYFKKMNFPEMAEYYNHHTLSFLQKFSHRVIKPSATERLFGLSYFPWIIIKKRT